MGQSRNLSDSGRCATTKSTRSSLLPDSVTSKYTPEQIKRAIANLTDKERLRLHANLEAKSQQEIIDRCRERVVAHDRGPMYWLREHTKTENYHWEVQNRQPREPFPYLPHPGYDHDYLDVVMRYLLQSKELYIPKTREMMTSWLVVGYIAWSCQFYANTQAVGQSEKDDKAKGLVEYANALYVNQADWMRAEFPLKRGEVGGKHNIQWANGSLFVAVPQGERQTASAHPTIYFNDESAHQPAWKATLNIVKPVANQIICVSSAAYSDFGDHVDQSLAI